MQLRSAPNKVRTVDMSETPVREIITKHVHELFGGASVRALAVLVADYVHCLIGRRRQRLTLDTDGGMRLNGISTSRLEFFPETGKCEWLARNGAHVSSTRITCDADWCFHAHAQCYEGFREGDVVVRPKPWTTIRRNTRRYGLHVATQMVILDTSLPSHSRVETELVGWPASHIFQVYSNGLGKVYKPTEGRASPFLEVDICGWDAGCLPSTRYNEYGPVLGYETIAKLPEGTFDHNGLIMCIAVDESAKKVWIATEEEYHLRRSHLYCFDVSASVVPKVLFQTTWTNGTRLLPAPPPPVVVAPPPHIKVPADDPVYWCGKASPSYQMWTDVFAISPAFRLFAILQSNGRVAVHCADTFHLVQDLDTGIPDQFTSVVNFRFLDFQDASGGGGPVLAFLVETRPSAERDAPRSYDLRVFMC